MDIFSFCSLAFFFGNKNKQKSLIKNPFGDFEEMKMKKGNRIKIKDLEGKKCFKLKNENGSLVQVSNLVFVLLYYVNVFLLFMFSRKKTKMKGKFYNTLDCD